MYLDALCALNALAVAQKIVSQSLMKEQRLVLRNLLR